MKTVLSEALARCEDEPIRVPGSVQQHGFFLLIDNSLEKVLAASENAAHFLDQPLKLILGARLDAILGRELLLALESMRNPRQSGLQALVTYLGTFRIGADQFSVMTHVIGSNRALEFEVQEQLVGPERMNSIITNFVATLERLQNSQDLCDALTEQVADLTGFDRVMLYSFNDEDHGTVLSEVNNGRLPAYLGLRFPASDIPKQARELYILNTTRIIPDASYTPSPLAGATTRPIAQLDLSLSVLRSVSPIHLQYMKNMGTAASMSVSILLNGKLWGLIGCHNATPKTVPYLIRSSCDMLAKMAATQLAKFYATARFEALVHFNAAQRSLLTTLAGELNYIAGLLGHTQALLKITNATGVAVLVDGRFAVAGITPDKDQLDKLAQWLDETPDREVFSSSHLQSVIPWATSMASSASGILAIRVSVLQRRYILWFRPEVVSTVRWAGNPVKQQSDALELHPRQSFEQWKEIVHGRAEPWTEMEIESATEFRSALTTIGLRRAEEAVELGEARFERLTQSLPVKIFTANDAGRLTYVNERWLSQGFKSNGLWYDQLLMNPEDSTKILDLWNHSVTNGQTLEAEIRLPASNGGVRWFFARVVPFQRHGAARAGWIGTLVDLTESKERETALRMNEKLALTGRMTSVIAHEINNPLEAITNLMYLIRGEFTERGTAGTYIDLVESELQRISGITKQTLRWNRETSDKPESFDLHFLADDVLRLFAGKIRNRQLTVLRQGPTSLLGWGTLGQVRQVLANLISNAIDAAPVNGSIQVSILQNDKETGFAVHDNGAGISPDMQARLFEPFVSTKGDLGNGLGLYISREIIERHHGKIEVDSTAANGTTMTVWLPTQPIA